MKLAAQSIDFGEFKGIGPLGTTKAAEGIVTLSSIISMAIGVMTIVAFIWFTFVFITGAIGIISSGGDKASLESARKRIVNGIVGVIVVIAAVFIINLVGTIFGIDFLNITKLFYQIPGIPGGKSP